MEHSLQVQLESLEDVKQNKQMKTTEVNNYKIHEERMAIGKYMQLIKVETSQAGRGGFTVRLMKLKLPFPHCVDPPSVLGGVLATCSHGHIVL